MNKNDVVKILPFTVRRKSFVRLIKLKTRNIIKGIPYSKIPNIEFILFLIKFLSSFVPTFLIYNNFFNPQYILINKI